MKDLDSFVVITGILCGIIIVGFIEFIIMTVNPPVIYKRNVIKVYYESDENGIRRGENIITIDLSGTKPKLIEQERTQ